TGAARLLEIIHRLMSPNRDGRPENAEALIAELDAFERLVESASSDAEPDPTVLLTRGPTVPAEPDPPSTVMLAIPTPPPLLQTTQAVVAPTKPTGLPTVIVDTLDDDLTEARPAEAAESLVSAAPEPKETRSPLPWLAGGAIAAVAVALIAWSQLPGPAGSPAEPVAVPVQAPGPEPAPKAAAKTQPVPVPVPRVVRAADTADHLAHRVTEPTSVITVFQVLVVTQPAGATVRNGDRRLGKTPHSVRWTSLDPQPTVRLYRRGYTRQTITLTGESSQRTLKLIRKARPTGEYRLPD
ncbi:MAG: hypothetical protein ACI9WU_005542, partial [Myxococcota bacterium]